MSGESLRSAGQFAASGSQSLADRMMRMADPSELPGDGPAIVHGIGLPSGRRLFAKSDLPSTPVLWATDEPVADAGALWRALRRSDRGGPFIPLLLSGLGGDVGERPWESGELRPAVPISADRLDPSELFARWWTDGVPDPEDDEDETAELLAPFSRRFPGLTPATQRVLSDEVIAEATESLGSARLGLVVAPRPADALAVIGWDGAVNTGQEPGELSVVLRSWEERFGATLIGIGFDAISLLVARPPQSHDEAVRVAAEHFAFCSDRVYQDAGSIRLLADELVDAPIWSFWWD
jgi:hypothetical protein